MRAWGRTGPAAGPLLQPSLDSARRGRPSSLWALAIVAATATLTYLLTSRSRATAEAGATAGGGRFGGLTFHERHILQPALQRCLIESAVISIPDALVPEPPKHCSHFWTPGGAAQLAAAASVGIGWTGCQRFVTAAEELEGSARVLQHMSRHTMHMRPNSSDHLVFMQAFCGNAFRFLGNMVDFVPNTPQTLLDAGANVGFASLLFAPFLRYSGRILAVDASPSTHEVLQRNMGPFAATVDTVWGAIVPDAQARRGGTVRFGGAAGEHWGNQVQADAAQPLETAYDVPTVSLPQLAARMPSKRFDFIKLDIEGAETGVLADEPSRAVLCKATCLFMELHERMVPGSRAAFDDFLRSGCGGKARFALAIQTGEYIAVCDKHVLEQGPADA